MKLFQYTLDKSSKKFRCPECSKKTFVRYKDVDGNYISEDFGRCDREVNCGYFLKPEENKQERPVFVPSKPQPDLPPSFIPVSDVLGTYNDYELNSFTIWLISHFGEERIQELINKYRFGVDDSGPYTKDWTVFWQYDIENRVRSGKIIKYDQTGHRDKEYSATWYHKKVRFNQPVFPEFNLKQCLFGEHLLPLYPNMPVAIVESEKTAIIASLFIDKYIWLACGGKSVLQAETVAVLKHRSVTLFPDLGAYEDWLVKAKEFGFNISNQLENIATPDDRLKGLDLADYLLY